MRQPIPAWALFPRTAQPLAALGILLPVSRGTVVACFEHPVAAGVLRRRQGLEDLGGRPSFAGPPAARSIAIMLLRRMAADPRLSTCPFPPSDLLHLPPTDPSAARAG